MFQIIKVARKFLAKYGDKMNVNYDLTIWNIDYSHFDLACSKRKKIQ